MMVVFLIAALGYALGNVKVAGLSLGTSGVLLVALVFGHFGMVVPASMKNFGLILFVAAVGFIAGPVFFRNFKKKAFAYIILGLVVVLLGAVTTGILIKLTGVSTPLAVGMFTGALTSTPGLATAVEVTGDSLASVGYGIAYPFGVVGVVLFIQLIPKLLKVNIPVEAAKLKPDTSIIETHEIKIHGWNKGVGTKLGELLSDGLKVDAYLRNGSAVSDFQDLVLQKGDRFKITGSVGALSEFEDTVQGELIPVEHSGFLSFVAAIVIGLLIAAIKIPLPGGLSFNLGTSGGPLIAGLIVGHFRKVGKYSLEVPIKTLETFREMGLMLFLMGAGTDAGKGFVEVLMQYGWGLFFMGALITLIPMVIGYFLARKLLKLELFNTLGSICGGMTSTPALGTLITVSGTDNVAASYAATYPIALIMVVFSTQILALIFR